MTKKRRWLIASGWTAVVVLGIMVAGPPAGEAIQQQDDTTDVRASDDMPDAFILPTADFAVFATEATATTTTAPTEDLSAGALYTNLCAVCHGAAGEGGIGPSLQASQWTESATAISITNGVGSMPDFSDSLTTDQIDVLSAYSFSLQTDTPTTTRTTQPPTEAGGSELYASTCAACHGASGEGGIGPSLETSIFTASDTVSAVADGVGSMPGFSESLTDTEITAVSDYSVAFQPQTQGATSAASTAAPSVTASAEAAGLYEANCAACHGAGGEGGVGPTLTGSVFTFDATVSAIADGVGSMPGFTGGLSQDQINDLAAYSVAFQGGTSAPDATASDGALPTGEGADIYAASCAACHGATGEGASAAPINVPFANDQLVEIIRVGIGDMPGFTAALTDDQVTVLAEFVHALALAAAPVVAEPAPTGEYIVAIQPSRYIEFDTDRTSIPLDPMTQLALALGSMAILGILIFSEVHRVRGANKGTASPDGMEPGATS